MKKKKIIYWVATLWLALGMASTGFVQLIKLPEEVEKLADGLGYPEYILPLLGVCKLAGVVVILLPNFGNLKEWVYAGFVFLMGGAIFSHLSAGNEPIELLGPVLLLLLSLLSWQLKSYRTRIAIA
jgi:hypothetical protein